MAGMVDTKFIIGCIEVAGFRSVTRSTLRPEGWKKGCGPGEELYKNRTEKYSMCCTCCGTTLNSMSVGVEGVRTSLRKPNHNLCTCRLNEPDALPFPQLLGASFCRECSAVPVL